MQECPTKRRGIPDYEKIKGNYILFRPTVLVYTSKPRKGCDPAGAFAILLLRKLKTKIMARNRNTNSSGGSWSAGKKMDVWKKGKPIPDWDENDWRWDICGTPMKFSEHGNRNSKHGWEVDHVNPVSNGGGDDLANLQPLNHLNNSAKADTFPWTCPKA